MPLVRLTYPEKLLRRFAALVSLATLFASIPTHAHGQDPLSQLTKPAANPANCVSTPVNLPPTHIRKPCPVCTKCPSVPCCAATNPCPQSGNDPKPDACSDKKAKVELELILNRAEDERKAGHWDKAEDLYGQGLKSGAADDRQQRQIRDDLANARAKTESWWWRWGAYFPPFRWICAEITPVSLWLVVAIIALFAITSVLARIFKGRGLFSMLGDLIKLLFMPPFRGRAHIVDPVKLTKDAETDLFIQALQYAAANEVGRRWARMQSRLQAGPVALLTIPSVLANTAVNGLPDIKGIDLGKIFKFVFIAVRYFGWRVESRLSFRPALAASAEHPASPARMRAYASVRWAWFVKETIVVERDVWDQYDVNALAFAIAARLGGIQFDRT